MSCGRRTLVKRSTDYVLGKELPCLSWACEYCRPILYKRLLAKGYAGKPRVWMQLGLKPRKDETEREIAQRLIICFRRWVQQIRHLTNNKFEYFYVWHVSPGGHVHIHILVNNWKFVSQALLSAYWHGVTKDSYVVWIEPIKRPGAVAYCVGYMADGLVKIAGRKRYGFSNGYLPAEWYDSRRDRPVLRDDQEVVRMTLAELDLAMEREGRLIITGLPNTHLYISPEKYMDFLRPRGPPEWETESCYLRIQLKRAA